MTLTAKLLICPNCRNRSLYNYESIDQFDDVDHLRIWEWICQKCSFWKSKWMINNGKQVIEINQ